MTRRAAVLCLAVLGGACWTGGSTVPPPPITPTDPPPASGLAMAPLVATLRIDATPGPRRFQGVWLEHGDKKWIIDYRARELWQAFDGAEVTVTGYCYVPFGEAISATHFQVETLRVERGKGRGRFVSIGPEQTITGTFRTQVWPSGSKLAGSSESMFDVDGRTFVLAGGEAAKPGAATIVARAVEIDPTYAATTGGDQLWIVSIHEPGWTEDPATAPKKILCPG